MLTQLLPNFCVGEKEDNEDEVVGKALAATSVAEMFELLLTAPWRVAEEEGEIKGNGGGGAGGSSSWDGGAEIALEKTTTTTIFSSSSLCDCARRSGRAASGQP